MDTTIRLKQYDADGFTVSYDKKVNFINKVGNISKTNRIIRNRQNKDAIEDKTSNLIDFRVERKKFRK